MHFPTITLLTLFLFIVVVVSTGPDCDSKSSDQPKESAPIDKYTLNRLSATFCKKYSSKYPLFPLTNATEPQPETTNGCPVYAESNSRELVEKFCASYEIIQSSPQGDVTLDNLVDAMCKKSNIHDNRSTTVAKRELVPSCPPQVVTRLDRHVMKFCKITKRNYFL